MVERRGMRAVADAAGVSVTTVANVLNKPDLVAPHTRRRVEDAMTVVGFVRNGAARQLRGVPSPVVGVATIDVADPFSAEVNRGVEDRVADEGAMMINVSLGLDHSRQNRTLAMLEEHGVRGILATPVCDDLTRFTQVAARGTPVVLLDHPAGGSGMCAVTADHRMGGRLAGEHLVGLGHRRIAFLTSVSVARSVRDRRAGLAEALRAGGLDVGRSLTDVNVNTPTDLIRGGDEAAERLMADAPTAIACLNDVGALGLLRGLDRIGVRVPDDVSVIGHDDLRFSGRLTPTLTTVRRSAYDLGHAAAGLLLDETRAGHRHREIRFQPSLVVRASTGPART